MGLGNFEYPDIHSPVKHPVRRKEWAQIRQTNHLMPQFHLVFKTFKQPYFTFPKTRLFTFYFGKRWFQKKNKKKKKNLINSPKMAQE